MHPSDPRIACTEQRINAAYDLCLELLTSQQSTVVTTLIADLVRERDAARLAFAGLVEAGEHLRDVLDSDKPPSDGVKAITAFEAILDSARTTR